MIRAALALCLACATASANGRPINAISIAAREPDDVVVGATFGLLVSHDAGVTWRWMCEQAIGYGGVYDPDYAISPSGAIFATTFEGLGISRDGCTFEHATAVFTAQVELGDGVVYTVRSDPSDGGVYRSTDDGMTFTRAGTPGSPNDAWTSLAIAADGTLYLAGSRVVAGGHEVLLLRSTDAGARWTPLSTAGLTTSDNSTLTVSTSVAGVFVHVSNELGTIGDGIYRSTTSGDSFTKIYGATDPDGLAFVARRDGSCVVGTRSSGAAISADCTQDWSDLVGAPHIGCLAERANGELWACTQNYGASGDGYAIMRSLDLATWTGVLRFEDIAGPVACAPGTAQADTCAPSWCMVATYLGGTCGSTTDDPPADAPVMPPLGDGSIDAPLVAPHAGGCCDAGGSPASGLVALAFLARRRRRTMARCRSFCTSRLRSGTRGSTCGCESTCRRLASS